MTPFPVGLLWSPDRKDPRAHLLRKYFVFMIVPMINVDGVFRGHFRLDSLNQNLNRYYDNTDPKKHPPVFGVKRLIEHLNEDKRLCFFCDYHGHGGMKSCFFYGNHMNFGMQVEAKLFAKIFSMNSMHFDETICNFSKKQMRARDKSEKLTKEGCARVFAYKKCNIPHSYTLEMAYHKSTSLNELPFVAKNTQNGEQLQEDQVSDISSSIYKNGPPFYNIEIYEDIGKSLLVSILDLFDKNQFSRISTSKYKEISAVRVEVAKQLNEEIPKEVKIPKDRIENASELADRLFYKSLVDSFFQAAFTWLNFGG